MMIDIISYYLSSRFDEYYPHNEYERRSLSLDRKKYSKSKIILLKVEEVTGLAS